MLSQIPSLSRSTRPPEPRPRTPTTNIVGLLRFNYDIPFQRRPGYQAGSWRGEEGVREGEEVRMRWNEKKRRARRNGMSEEQRKERHGREGCYQS